LGHLLTRSGLTNPELLSVAFLRSFCRLECCETFQWLKCPLNGLRAQSMVSPVTELKHLASGQACFGMAFPPFLMKQLFHCDSVVFATFVGTGYTTRRWGWLLGRRGYGIMRYCPLCPCTTVKCDDILNENALLSTALDFPSVLTCNFLLGYTNKVVIINKQMHYSDGGWTLTLVQYRFISIKVLKNTQQNF
jgi:hypothetical protein